MTTKWTWRAKISVEEKCMNLLKKSIWEGTGDSARTEGCVSPQHPHYSSCHRPTPEDADGSRAKRRTPEPLAGTAPPPLTWVILARSSEGRCSWTSSGLRRLTPTFLSLRTQGWERLRDRPAARRPSSGVEAGVVRILRPDLHQPLSQETCFLWQWGPQRNLLSVILSCL